ncbi:hypothetical protein HO133_007835 [Letharia lupina]|uniref:Uncharacterized protein n=1 Tax=Letharia lupina TaxID=560253 RepID=A0A8H6CR97_9LECA|nr:uncharacterized protein HO133_007835 [Letharia lupina]KAF6228107.1 hypothetical protein HO133_007835 [Letharia lupina]
MPDLVDAAAVNSSALGALSVRCDGALYGFNPNIADCEGAAQFIVPDSEQLVWGERHTGLPVGIFPLPFAVFGDKAECVVRTIVRGAGPTARASLVQVKRAAAALSLQCAAGGQSQGGIATNIGGDNNLAVILSTYKPKIQCGSAQTFSDASSCEGLLADMPASTAKVLFGPDDVPGVREPLPQLIASGKLSRDVHTPVSVLRPTEIQQVTTNVSSGSSPRAEQIPPLGTASGRPRKRRLRGVPGTGNPAASGDWVGSVLAESSCGLARTDSVW